MRVRMLALVLAVAICGGGLAAPALAVGVVREAGYLTMEDGVRLRYSLERPDRGGPFPTVFQYNGYGAGSSPRDNGLGELTDRLLAEGFAVIGVSLRGSGCSEGRFDMFEPQQSDDGAKVVDWIAEQPWSNGRVGMAGLSYSGITQFMVASRRPAALAAIAPNVAITDLYRDVGWPGGIYNQTFAYGWTANQKSGHQYLPSELGSGNTGCAVAAAGQNHPEHIVGVQGQRRPFADDDLYERFLTPQEMAAIDVPTLGFTSWQDEQLGGRMSDAYPEMNGNKTWLMLGNGAHDTGAASKLYFEAMIKFFRRYLLDERNGWEATPKVQLLHEVSRAASEPGWVTSHSQWPVPGITRTLYLHGDGSLRPESAEEAGQLDYRYPQPAPNMVMIVDQSHPFASYKVPVPDGGSVVFTTPAAAKDFELLGPMSLDLWLASTATDTDLQVSLTEVRPDGQELYLNRGWLRASKRALDETASTPTKPVQTFAAADAKPLAPGEATPMRVEIWPLNHVVRAGSALRLYVEAPVGFTGFRQLQFNPTPAINSVLVGPEYPSRLVMHQVAGGRAQAAMPACDTLVNQPCRPNSVPVPEGQLRFADE